mmetsp:Transcript_10835/g.31322  ORF Transcript_10835/g.31322 Transcript_10835/m.31322 type:complete len:207 (+) Transcript_10835:423-1043(+)
MRPHTTRQSNIAYKPMKMPCLSSSAYSSALLLASAKYSPGPYKLPALIPAMPNAKASSQMSRTQDGWVPWKRYTSFIPERSFARRCNGQLLRRPVLALKRGHSGIFAAISARSRKYGTQSLGFSLRCTWTTSNFSICARRLPRNIESRVRRFFQVSSSMRCTATLIAAVSSLKAFSPSPVTLQYSGNSTGTSAHSLLERPMDNSVT